MLPLRFPGGVQETLVQDDVLEITEEQFQVMAFDSVLNEMCRSGEPDQTLALAREITDDVHRARLMAELALTLLEKGELDLARSVAEECWQTAATMPNHPLHYEADEYHAEHDDDSWRSSVLTDLLRFWERLGEMKKAEELLIEIVKTPEAIVTPKPT